MEKCQLCRTEIDPTTININSNGNQEWKCVSCSLSEEKKFSNSNTSLTNKKVSISRRSNDEKETYPKHIITIPGESLLYKCTVCDKTFKTKSNCCYHKHCADDSEKPYSCLICNRKFSSKTHFTYHNFMHTGVNPFKCDSCEKSFKTKNKLLRHKQVHSDKRKLYQCDLCDRSFLRKTSIKVHRKSHTGEKPYTCSYCSKAFNEKKKLIHHISSHTGIKNWICEVCGKSYSIKWNLELHKRTHSKVRPYYCQECQQSFSQNRYLKRHMETHKNSVKYLCNLCDKEFSRKDNLQRHIVNTHLEQENPNRAKIQKLALYNNPSALITKIIKSPSANDSSSSPIVLNTPPRTESVIKSLTKTQQIINFNCQDIETISNRVSVIRKVDRSCNDNDNNASIATKVLSPLHLENYAEIENCVENSSDEIACVAPAPEERSPVTITANICENYDEYDKYRDNSGGYSGLRDCAKSPRCFLPKKMITASYKERLTSQR